MRQRFTPTIAVILSAILLQACVRDATQSPTAPEGASRSAGMSTVSVCHIAGTGRGDVIDVANAALPAHVGHGDYVAELFVDHAFTGGDGVHYPRISDAIEAVRSVRFAHDELRAAACRITIEVLPGTYVGSFDDSGDATTERFPLFIDVPRVSLIGALVMPLDAAGRATGAGSSVASSVLRPDRQLPAASAMLMLVGNPQGSAADSAIVRGFQFESVGSTGAQATGAGMGMLRVTDVVITGNDFSAPLSTAVDSRESSVRASANYVKGMGTACGFCFAGPGSVTVVGNRLLDGDNVGVFFVAYTVQPDFPLGNHAGMDWHVDDLVPPTSATLLATAINNDVSNHTHNQNGVATGFRVIAHSKSTAAVAQSAKVTLDGNSSHHNSFGLIIDAGFPAGGVSGNVDVTLRRNSLYNNCQHNVLVSFARHTQTLGTSTGTGYLRNSTYHLDFEDTPWADAWYDHQAGLGNTLVVDGEVPPTVAPARVVAFNPLNTTCAVQP